jgi:hypothetical protein
VSIGKSKSDRWIAEACRDEACRDPFDDSSQQLLPAGSEGREHGKVHGGMPREIPGENISQIVAQSFPAARTSDNDAAFPWPLFLRRRFRFDNHPA